MKQIEIINLIITILVLVTNIYFGFYLNKKIEKIKLKNSRELSGFSSELSLLNKKSEIKFQKFQIEQADALKALYSNWIDLKYKTYSIYNTNYKTSPHDEFKAKLSRWVNQYNLYHKFFYINRILFSQDITDMVSVHLSYLNKMYKIIVNKIGDLEETEMIYHYQLENVYENSDEELDAITKEFDKLKTEMKNGVEDFKFDQIAKELENEYKKILG